MGYIENPKVKGSGIVCCIPQKGECPNKCPDCFFQSGRSYLEPLEKNLPNMPDPELVGDRIVRVNDGNDSNFQKDLVIESTKIYKHKFYNTAIPDFEHMGDFPGPVVLTVNPGELTDTEFFKLKPTNGLVYLPYNLMFVRVRTNTWNDDVVDGAVKYYTSMKVPVVLTFMAYHDRESIKITHHQFYTYRQRTTNSYWAITTDMWSEIMGYYSENPYVYSCGKVEGERGTTACMRCGNCVREYWVTKERMEGKEL